MNEKEARILGSIDYWEEHIARVLLEHPLARVKVARYLPGYNIWYSFQHGWSLSKLGTTAVLRSSSLSVLVRNIIVTWDHEIISADGIDEEIINP